MTQAIENTTVKKADFFAYIGEWFSLDCGSPLIEPKKKEKRLLFLIGCMLGLVIFLLLYGTLPLDVTNDGWVMRGHVEHDIKMEYTIWEAYRHAPWSWPIGYVETVDYPAGSSIALAAPYFLTPLLKLLNPILPETFQYYGIWALACHMLQGGVAAILINLFTQKRLTILLGSVLFIFAPVFLERSFRHTSLSCQFLLLLALYYYFDAVRNNNTKHLFPKLLALCVFSMLCVTYYFVMVFAIVVVLLFDLRKKMKARGKISLYLRWLTMVVLCLVVPALFAYAFGLFVIAGSAIEPYGYYSMNVNQIYNPVSYQALEPASPDQTLFWSRILPQFPLRDGMNIRAGGQYDGFNYLGFGVLLALAVLCVVFLVKNKKESIRATKPYLKKYTFLFLLMIFLCLYSWSNIVFWGQRMMVTYYVPYAFLRLTSFFRASARMFYPVYYLLFLMVVLYVPRLFKKKQLGIAALALVVAIQLFDISPALAWKHEYFKTQTAPYTSPYAGTALEYAVENYDNIWINTNQYSDYDLMLMVSRNGNLNNLQYGPRYISEVTTFTQEQIARWRSGQMQSNEAILIYDDDALVKELRNIYEDRITVTKVNDLYVIIMV